MMAKTSCAKENDASLSHRVALAIDATQRRLLEIDEQTTTAPATPDLDRENDELLDVLAAMQRLLTFMPADTSMVALAQVDHVADCISIMTMDELTTFEAARAVRDIRRMLFSVSGFLRMLPGGQAYEMSCLTPASDARGCTGRYIERLC